MFGGWVRGVPLSDAFFSLYPHSKNLTWLVWFSVQFRSIYWSKDCGYNDFPHWNFQILYGVGMRLTLPLRKIVLLGYNYFLHFKRPNIVSSEEETARLSSDNPHSRNFSPFQKLFSAPLLLAQLLWKLMMMIMMRLTIRKIGIVQLQFWIYVVLHALFHGSYYELSPNIVIAISNQIQQGFSTSFMKISCLAHFYVRHNYLR